MADTNSAAALAKLRSHFPGATQSTYFDTATRGLIPVEVKTAIDEQVNHRIRGDFQKPKMFELIERVRNQYAALIGADSNEIAYTKNVSEGPVSYTHLRAHETGRNLVCRL